MHSSIEQSTDKIYASEGQLLPIKIKQKELLDDSQSSHTEACEDEIPSENLPERPNLQAIELNPSQMHHHRPSNHPMRWSPTGEMFSQSAQEKARVKKCEGLFF